MSGQNLNQLKICNDFFMDPVTNGSMIPNYFKWNRYKEVTRKKNRNRLPNIGHMDQILLDGDFGQNFAFFCWTKVEPSCDQTWSFLVFFFNCLCPSVSLGPKKHFRLTLEHIFKYLATPSVLPCKAIFEVQIESSCDFLVIFLFLLIWRLLKIKCFQIVSIFKWG